VKFPFTAKFPLTENKPMTQLMNDSIDLNYDEKLALKWSRHVDINKVSPKLPVHLHLEIKKINKVSQMRDATSRSDATTRKLDCINIILTLIPHHHSININGEDISTIDYEVGDARDTDGSSNLYNSGNMVESGSVLNSPDLADSDVVDVGSVPIYGDGEFATHNKEDGGGGDVLGGPGLAGDGVADYDSVMTNSDGEVTTHNITGDSDLMLDDPSLADEGVVDDESITSDGGIEVAIHKNAGGSCHLF
jgi:hypothetical protein